MTIGFKGFWRWVALGTAIAVLVVTTPQMASSRVSETVELSIEPLTVAQQTVNSQFDRWRSNYINNDYEAAISILEPLLDDTGNSRTARGLAYSYLSLTHQKLGNWEAARTAIDRATALIGVPSATASTSTQRIFAATLNTRGQLQFSLGEMELAYDSWREATGVYRRLSDEEGVTGGLLNQAQALQAMGFARRACDTVLQGLGASVQQCQALEEDEIQAQIEESIDRLENPALRVALLQGLGNGLRSIGKFPASREVLQQALVDVSGLSSPDLQSSVWLDLGNTERAILTRDRDLRRGGEERRGSMLDAIEYYQQARSIANSPYLQLQSQLNLLSLLVEPALGSGETFDNLPEIEPLARQSLAAIRELKIGRTTLNARANLACSVIGCDRLERNEPPESLILPFTEIESLLTVSDVDVDLYALSDERTVSYLLGTLGKLYERQNETLDQAENATQKALELAIQGGELDLAYQWQWQLGRILNRQNAGSERAISAYENAVEQLEGLRQDLTRFDLASRISFRQKIEPVYRQFFEVALQEETPSQEQLEKVRARLSDFQLAELENYLQCSLQEDGAKSLDEIAAENRAAILYPVILPQKIAVIAKLPGVDRLIFTATEISETEVLRKIQEFRKSLQQPNINRTNLELSRAFFEWLIHPIESHPEFQAEDIETLVFVPDTRLRNIPMSALRYEDCDDGKCYLIQKYAIAMNLGISLKNPQPLRDREMTVLMGGLIEGIPERQLEALEYVESELDAIEATLEATGDLRDRSFIRPNLEFLLNNRSSAIIHLATHGKFSSEPESTLLSTWYEDIYLQDIAAIFQTQRQNQEEPIELLVLSACETGVEDTRATLGLAGVSVQSGARSTLASLWNVNERSSAILMDDFYRNLTDSTITNKAKALQAAQIEMLENENSFYSIPLHWAPYILIGNWL
ncbi:CHAT domain-containing protein [Baaleninema sp.]|uniref:CHAT domain-containing protein n=1 Tax=Baaleninema sp. TaxID=3101197 RepID=UPI003D04F192